MEVIKPGMVKVFKALGNDKRAKIINAIAELTAEGEKATFDKVREKAGLGIGDMGYHLKVLKSAGIVGYVDEYGYVVSPMVFDLAEVYEAREKGLFQRV
ncbi:MAG: hypothetical protein DRO36_06860 [Candidatus Hecatellales archaeon]|nr:MAG: hypothetical protein DRO36_06860 [Candidatus Hecatellales archaeon]